MRVAGIPEQAEAELARLRAENRRLLSLLKLTPQQAAPPRPGQAAFFEAAPGLVQVAGGSEDRVLRRAVRGPHRYLRDPVGQPAHRQARLDPRRARRVAQGRSA